MSEATSDNRASAFLALHARDGAFVLPNPWDVGSARMLEALGFEALATTSAGLAFALGVRDGNVGRDALLAHVGELRAATSLPISADLENGFGHTPDAVAETLRAGFAAGLAGGSIEDHTGDRDAPIYPFEQALERVVAAVETVRDLPGRFVFTARAENFLWGRRDLDDTIARLVAFEEAGADVLYAPGLRDLEQVRAVCAAVSKPVNVVMGMPGTVFGVSDLAAAGVRRVSLGSAFARAALGGFLRAAREVRELGTFGFAADAAGFAEIEKLLPN